MATGTLTGYSLRLMGGMGFFGDHTYVDSSDGRAWGCGGRSSGGTAICGANGDIDRADCLAQPDAQAGITWFGDGVCHQMSNRILYPAIPSLLVGKARLYMVSTFRWGTYGLDPAGLDYSPLHNPWPELLNC